MKTLSLILLICFSYTLSAQMDQFAPIGAEWNFYTTHWDSGNIINNFSILVENDTVIQGKECTIIHNYTSSEIVHSEGQKVFVFRDSIFHLVFDFDAQIGDTVVVFEGPFEPFFGQVYNYEYGDTLYDFSYIINEIDSTQINGEWVISQIVESIGDWEFYSISEKTGAIGILGHMFGNDKSDTFSGSFVAPFLYCYSDHNTHLSFISNFNCDWALGIEDHNKTMSITFSPNPAIDFLNFQFPTITKKTILQIFNSIGQNVIATELNIKATSQTLSINSLPSGIYYWKIDNQSGRFNIK